MRESGYMSLRKQIAGMPVIDSHGHILHPDILSRRLQSSAAQSPALLADTITGPENRIALLSSGMSSEQLQAVMQRKPDIATSRMLLLQHLPNIENTVSYNWLARGIQELYDFDLRQLNEHNWDELEQRMQAAYRSRYAWMAEVFDRLGIRRLLLNMGTEVGAYYYSEYIPWLSEADAAADARCFARIATFDSHAMDPFSAACRRYAEWVDEPYTNLDEYEGFLEKLAERFVQRCQVKGFKFSEAYFRRLDYEEADRESAHRAFKPDRTAEEQRQLSNYISNRILALAGQYGVPAQFHTGMRWGDLALQDLSPIYLESTLRRFPQVKFDLMHGGFPHLGEMTVMAANTPNVYINLSYLTVISYEAAAQWLSTCLDTVPANKISFGSDVFHLETLYGGSLYVKDIIAEVLSGKVTRGLLTETQALSVARKLLYDNANALFSLGLS